MTNSSGVKVSFAYDSENDRLISVAKAFKGKDYECYECNGRLRKRSGESKREHFFHLGKTNCTISYESSLHMGAKLFLKESLEDGKPVEIHFPTGILPDTELKGILKKEGISNIQLPIDKLFNNLLTIHELEAQTGLYRADILSRNSQREIVMLWEIAVSHEIERDKRSFLQEKKIPFLELRPYEKDADKFAYNVISFNELACFKAETFKLANLIDLYSQELGSEIAWVYIKSFLENIENLVFEQLIENLDHALITNVQTPCLVEDTLQFFQQEESFEIWQTYFKIKKPDTFRYERLEHLGLENFGIKFNRKYYPDSTINMPNSFFKQFSQKICLTSQLNEKKELVSVRCEFFIKDFRKAALEVNNGEEPNCLRLVNLQLLEYDGSDPKDPHFKIEYPDASSDMFVNARLENPIKLFFDFLNDLMTVGKIDLILGKGAKGFDAVYGFRIAGIYSIKAYNLAMRAAVIKMLKEIFFNPPPKIPSN